MIRQVHLFTPGHKTTIMYLCQKMEAKVMKSKLTQLLDTIITAASTILVIIELVEVVMKLLS